MIRNCLLAAILVLFTVHYAPDAAKAFARWVRTGVSKVVEVIESTVVGEIPEDKRFRSSSNLSIFAKQLSLCAQPGPRVDDLVDRYSGTPLERLIAVYAELRSRWHYRDDGEFETLQTAEASLGPLQYEGDCEDFAVTMMAVLSSIDGITARIVLCYGENEGEPGHAFCEVLLGTDSQETVALLERLMDSWQIPEMVIRKGSGSVWVPLDFSPPEKIYKGPVCAFILADGTVTFPSS